MTKTDAISQQPEQEKKLPVPKGKKRGSQSVKALAKVWGTGKEEEDRQLRSGSSLPQQVLPGGLEATQDEINL